MNKLFPIILFVLLQFCTGESNLSSTSDLYKVIAITDGDSFTVLKNSVQVRIRVNAIDAPERGMPFNKVAKQHLSDLCFEQMVALEIVKTDRYGRSVANVILPDGRDVATEMIKSGLAWHYKLYSADKNLASLELKAREAKMGLWKDHNPIAPWEIRALRRKGISTKEYFKKTK